MNPVHHLYQSLDREVGKAVVGMAEAKDELFCTLIAGGHVLIEGVPGIAKTLLVRTLAAAVGVQFRRIQFTPDLMPTDILGSHVYDPQTANFHYRRGPIFTDILLADEINRTPPKTQSALLEAMQERAVTSDGQHTSLGDLFTVVATQNPLEFEGTYPLPEAQLDRFMLKVLLDYPEESEERELIQRVYGGFDAQDLATVGVAQVAGPEAWREARNAAMGIRVEEPLREYVLRIVRQSRDLPTVLIGGSPRAAIALLRLAQVYAAVRGSDFVIPDDIKRFVKPVLRHRLILRPEAEIEGMTTDVIVEGLLEQVDVPR